MSYEGLKSDRRERMFDQNLMRASFPTQSIGTRNVAVFTSFYCIGISLQLEPGEREVCLACMTVTISDHNFVALADFTLGLNRIACWDDSLLIVRAPFHFMAIGAGEEELAMLLVNAVVGNVEPLSVALRARADNEVCKAGDCVLRDGARLWRHDNGACIGNFARAFWSGRLHLWVESMIVHGTVLDVIGDRKVNLSARGRNGQEKGNKSKDNRQPG